MKGPLLFLSAGLFDGCNQELNSLRRKQAPANDLIAIMKLLDCTMKVSPLSQPYCAPISPTLPRNLAVISAQSGWGCLAIWLRLDCNKAEGVLPLTRTDFTWPCPPVHRAGH